MHEAIMVKRESNIDMKHGNLSLPASFYLLAKRQ